MNVFKVTSDGETYTENDVQWGDNTPLGYYPRILDAANALVALRKKFDEAQEKSNEDEVTRFHDGIYPLAIVLEIDGEPMGTVRYVDDFVTWIPFKVEKHDGDSD